MPVYNLLCSGLVQQLNSLTAAPFVPLAGICSLKCWSHSPSLAFSNSLTLHAAHMSTCFHFQRFPHLSVSQGASARFLNPRSLVFGEVIPADAELTGPSVCPL